MGLRVSQSFLQNSDHERGHPVLKRRAIGSCPSGTELPPHAIPTQAENSLECASRQVDKMDRGAQVQKLTGGHGFSRAE